MAENAARVDWAGLGVRLPRRLCTPRGVRLAVRRALGRRGLAPRVRRVAAWIAAHHGGVQAAEEIETWFRRGTP
jgi:UDP:flavonoid glycosyltransferase YjiC (YdhE family)